MPRKKRAIHETVLVVDDDSDIRESLSELLDEKGYSVLQAENRRIALDVLKNVPHSPCMVVLDLAMPVLHGHEFLKHRAVDPARRHIPEVGVSDTPEPMRTLEDLEAYLHKPVAPDR